MKQLELKVSKTVKEKTKEVELSVEAPVNVSDKAYSLALRDISSQIDFPGFRKGKVPREIIEKRFGAGYIGQKAFEGVFGEVLFNVAEQEKIDIVDVLEISSYELTPGKPLTFKILVELKPEVKLGKYKNLKVDVKKTIFDKDAFIKKSFDKLAANLTTFQKVDNRPLKQGDLVNLDFEGKFDDGSDMPGGKAENFQVMFEKDKFLPEFIDKLVGSKVGEEKEITITFPENYAKDFSGKKGNFKVKINGIEEKVIPEIDDEVAKKVGFENLTKLKEQIEVQMKLIQDSNSKKEFENKLVDEIIKSSKYEVSDRMIEKESDYLLSDMKKNAEKDGINWGDFKKDSKNKELLQKASEAALKRISIDLVLTNIIKAEKISVTKEEIVSEVKNRILQMGEKYNYLSNDPKFVNMVEFVLVRNKAVDFLINNNEAVWEEVVTKDIPD